MDDTARKPTSLTTMQLMFFPVILHAVGITVGFVRGGAFPFRKLDLAVFLGVLAYLALVVLAVRKGERSSRRLVLLTYSILVPIILVESVFVFLGSEQEDGLPWPPMRRVAEAADTMPGIDGEITFTVNQRGVRGPESWPADRRDRVLCVGGSTTECYYVTDEKSWPWLLGTKLTKQLGRDVLVSNAGRSGHITLHHAYQLRHYKHADQFGIIVILCGLNDAGTLLRGNYEQRAAEVADEALVNSDRAGAYYRSSFVLRTVDAIRRVLQSSSVAQDSGGEWYVALREKRRQLLATNTIASVPVGLPASLAKYRANVIDIIMLCSDRDQKLVFLTQPTMYRKDISEKDAALIWQHTDSGAYLPEILDEVISAFNATLKSVCSEYETPCVDLAAQLPKDTSVFYDDCHFNVEGCEAVSTILSERLAEDLR